VQGDHESSGAQQLQSRALDVGVQVHFHALPVGNADAARETLIYSLGSRFSPLGRRCQAPGAAP